MVGLVEGRANQVVHARVDDDELLLTAGLAVQHAREQHARVPDEEAPGLHDQREARARGRRHDRLGERVGVDRQLVVVGDGEAAADVEVPDLRRPLRAELLVQLEEPHRARPVRLGLCHL